MAVYKILDDFYEPTFAIIAIHSYLEDYKLAYFLNLHLRSKLKRLSFNIDFKDTTSFSLYEWEDKYQDTVWNLISNKSHMDYEISEEVISLFNSNYRTLTRFLIPERSKVDFFLKIDNGLEVNGLKKIVDKINQITAVSTAYSINIEALKSRNNLIF
ncbi:IPExxxVDY family protein [Ascidiimonas sp. W6]|uniref:IPExxxVDY family protein n=1 Tax=Ascidiimonas meishanensis TaxID=3128903 RepID=UPI0030ED83EF